MYFNEKESSLDTVINLRAKKKTNSSVKLTWKKQKNIKKWTIDLYSGFDDYEGYDKTIKTIKKNVSSYTVKNLKKKQVYYMQQDWIDRSGRTIGGKVSIRHPI